ncbi:TPA: hypothetical protein O4H83_003470 [Vibrio cholerae]|uniref:hypothetical protein n=1 Tax=Vibrio cholerae TaxID=666 RepID=UPI0021CE4F0C|nr:hypothetical protein [Vibrio cholerae]MCU4222289.1 hypothetical protein [Vibrio cholerae]HCZ9577548.1 hypothetical protein [Vibrio cholerae]HCZ9602516.1 hypothetical protein [Vibrio cholerae]HCZ9606305.1 hypothetical protein [Vibrio cholerae]HCZ9638196.1 hypothetical protein [Vibrio cholerae]
MSDSGLDIIAERLKIPLGAVAIANRKQLLLFSVLGIIVTVVGVMPAKIAMLGIEFDTSNQQAFLVLLTLSVVYYLISFVVSMLSDLMSWKVLFTLNKEKLLMNLNDFDISHLTRAQVLEQMKLENSAINQSKLLFSVRILVDVVVPITLSLFSAFCLVSAI